MAVIALVILAHKRNREAQHIEANTRNMPLIKQVTKRGFSFDLMAGIKAILNIMPIIAKI